MKELGKAIAEITGFAIRYAATMRNKTIEPPRPISDELMINMPEIPKYDDLLKQSASRVMETLTVPALDQIVQAPVMAPVQTHVLTPLHTPSEAAISILAEKDKETRTTCVDCAKKHLSQAKILLDESRKGYPEHFWIALGHMAEAEDELISKYPEWANRIRDERKLVESDKTYTPDYAKLIMEIDAKCSYCGYAKKLTMPGSGDEVAGK